MTTIQQKFAESFTYLALTKGIDLTIREIEELATATAEVVKDVVYDVAVITLQTPHAYVESTGESKAKPDLLNYKLQQYINA